jgi:hypothetical protein
MLAKVNIPDETYRELDLLASQRGGTVEDLVLEGLELVKQTGRRPDKSFEIPTIPSDRPGALDLTNEQIYDLIGFP